MIWKARVLCVTVAVERTRGATMSPSRDGREQLCGGHEQGVVGLMCAPLQRTEGQPPAIAANGGLSYMSFDRDGDAGTAKCARGRAQRDRRAARLSASSTMIDNAPPGPIKTRWGVAFRDYDECVRYIRESNSLKAPQGWRGAAAGLYRLRAADLFHRFRPMPCGGTRRVPTWLRSCASNEEGNRRRDLYFPQVLRDARAHRRVPPGPLRPTAPNAWTGSASRWRTSSPRARTSTMRPRWSASSTPRSRSSSSRSSPMRPTPWSTTTTSFDKGLLRATRTEDQDNKNPGCERPLRQPRAQRPERHTAAACAAASCSPGTCGTSGARSTTRRKRPTGRCRGGSCRSHLAKPMETVEQFPFVLCAWPSFADQPYITNYRLYDDRCRRDHPLHVPSKPRVVLVSPADADRGLDA